MEIPKSFLGYKRENGRAGTRNHVIILPVDDISNACAEAVANNIKGTMALPHSYGRLQFGADLDLHFRTMIGTGCNPNVAAVIVIGIEPKWTKKIVDGIAKTGKPVEGFHIERTGDIGTVMKASKKAQELVDAGITTIDGLRLKQDELLNDIQKVGLKYYEEILERIPRSEIVEYETLFKNIVFYTYYWISNRW